jgi:hypothetical protein
MLVQCLLDCLLIVGSGEEVIDAEEKEKDISGLPGLATFLDSDSSWKNTLLMPLREQSLLDKRVKVCRKGCAKRFISRR